MKMKTAMAAIALVAVMAFASVAVLENNVSDAAGLQLMGYGESGTPSETKLGDVQAFYYEEETKYVLKVTLPADPRCDVSVSVNKNTGTYDAPVVGDNVTIVKVVRSSTEIMVYTDDLTGASGASEYVVTVTPLAGGEPYSTPLTTNPAGYVKVSFDANTGTVASGKAAYVEDYIVKGQTYTMPTSDGVYEKTDYAAGKWSIATDSKDNLIADGVASAAIDEDTTFSVMWAYEITFNGNGGKTTDATTLTEKKQTEYFGVDANLDANPFEFTDANSQTYDFYKWSDAADNMDVLTGDGTAVPGEKHTYYAIWTYTIEFNNDYNTYVKDTYKGVTASGSTDPFPVYLNGTKLIESYPLNINGFGFTHLDYLGWALESGADAKVTELDAAVTHGFNYESAYTTGTTGPHTATLYAVWAPHQYEVTITGLNADVKYFAANTYGENPTYDPNTGTDVVFDENGKATFIRDDTASPKTKGVTYWDKFEISAHGNYQINSVFYTIKGVSTVINGDSSSPVKYVFTKVLTDDAVITISDKKAYSIYGHVTKVAVSPTTEPVVSNADMEIIYNNIIFDDSTGLLIINKKMPVSILKVELYDYQKFVATESPEAVLVKDITANKLADSRYSIASTDLKDQSDAYHDVIIVVTYGPLDKPYTDFYVSDAQNNGTQNAKVTVTLRSASDAEFEIAAGSMKIYGTYFNTETLGGSPVAVYGALDGTEFEMKANFPSGTPTTTKTPTIVFEAVAADTNIYWVYAEYTYGEPAVTDATEGVLVVQTYDVTMDAKDGSTVIPGVTLSGAGTYIAGSTVTLEMPKTFHPAEGNDYNFSTLTIGGTSVTPKEVEGEDKYVYTFIITADSVVTVTYTR